MNSLLDTLSIPLIFITLIIGVIAFFMFLSMFSNKNKDGK